MDRTGDTSTPVSVNYATGAAGDTAVAGTNYTTESGTLNFPASPTAGFSQQSFTIPISAVYPQGGNKTFTIKLSGATGNGAVLGVSSTVVTIVDNGELFNLSSPTYSVNETVGSDSNNVHTAIISVLRTGVTSDAATVNFTTGEAATRQ